MNKILLKKKVLASAVAALVGATTITGLVSTTAWAQSNASGVIYGKTNPGAKVELKNTDTNATRTINADGAGKFTASALAAGHYIVTSGDQIADVDVIVGQGVEAVFGALQIVEVSGQRTRIDVTKASNGATFTAKELAKLPVARNLDAIVQLAPNTVKGDPTYAAGQSFAGGAVSENAYYINGFPTTNPLTQLGASELPFGAIAQAEVLVGGYDAEFGRSVGGVVNVAGKSGTNKWEAGAMYSSAPASMRARTVDLMYPVIGESYTSATDGTLRVRRRDNTITSTQKGVYVGGPLWVDRLFMFGAYEETETERAQVNPNLDRTSASLANSGFRDIKTKNQRYYAKFDFNITNNHRLEASFFGDTTFIDTKNRSYNYATGEIGSKIISALHEQDTGVFAPNGSKNKVFKYTGTLTDNITFSGLYGTSVVKHIYEPAGYNPGLFSVTSTAADRAPGLNYVPGQTFTGVIPSSGSSDKVEFYFASMDYTWGDHTFKVGADRSRANSIGAGNISAGGGNWTYSKAPDATKPTPLSATTLPILTPFGPLAAQGYYVSRVLSQTASNAYTGQSALFIQDKWQIHPNVSLNIGLRSESFFNADSNNAKFIEINNTLSPRISAAWDVNGDSSLKVLASAGRYTVQMPTVVALRAANGSLNTSQYYTYTGTDSNGLPTGLTELTKPVSSNNEFGQPKHPDTVASKTIKPSTQDEITLGFEKAFSSSLNFGAKTTYRKLGVTLDDMCDGRYFIDYAKKNNIDLSGWKNEITEDSPHPYFSCAIFNVGEAGSFMIDYKNTGKDLTRVDISAADMKFDKARRVYKALDLFVEHPYRDGWYAKVNYTLSNSKGDTEGQTRSDGNTGQGDVATTAVSDYWEYQIGAYGDLPNDRRHQIKAFGWYDLTDELRIGANLLLGSGRPASCVGKNPVPNFYNYGSERYCFGSPNSTKNVATPRGTTGRTPWEKNLDLNLSYFPKLIKGALFRLDVFNVFNKQTPLRTNEVYNVTSGNRRLDYGGVTRTQEGRYVRLTVEYTHKF